MRRTGGVFIREVVVYVEKCDRSLYLDLVQPETPIPSSEIMNPAPEWPAPVSTPHVVPATDSR